MSHLSTGVGHLGLEQVLFKHTLLNVVMCTGKSASNMFLKPCHDVVVSWKSGWLFHVTFVVRRGSVIISRGHCQINSLFPIVKIPCSLMIVQVAKMTMNDNTKFFCGCQLKTSVCTMTMHPSSRNCLPRRDKILNNLIAFSSAL